MYSPTMDEFMSNVNQFPGLPPELMQIIFGLLCRADQQTFALLSQSCRQLALPTLFRKVVYTRNVAYNMKELNNARADVRSVIKELVLKDASYKVWDLRTFLFPFLRTLPNLQCFRWSHSIAARNQPFFQLVGSLQHCPLEHLTYWAPRVPEEPVAGPPRLKTLSVKFHHAHIYDLIRPSFSTLVELEIYPGTVKFDLLPLIPLGRTLRKFAYKVDGFDLEILDTIPDVFPHLTTLELVVWNSTQFQWMNFYDAAIAKNTRLQYLAVFAYDFTFCGGDAAWRHVNCLECGEQRVQAMRGLAMSCIGLRRTRWNTSHTQYFLNVTPSEGNTPMQIEITLISDDFPPEPFTDCRR